MSPLFLNYLLHLFTETHFFSGRSIARWTGYVFEGKPFLCRISDRSLNVKCILMRCSYVWIQNERHHDIFSHGTIIDLLEFCQVHRCSPGGVKSAGLHHPTPCLRVWHTLHTISVWLQIKHTLPIDTKHERHIFCALVFPNAAGNNRKTFRPMKSESVQGCCELNL